ncbi:ACP S-malonyltransferase [Leptospira sp. GIMC2001]|uniref:ACP S-malonyltransferase n=1 Tax=Leptospira sp. GIMC2001 TaxID=1513297 RepID=UPI00234ADC76|nr:ACP S-malonyltransferase [Leptospira sp. GIMC2001]WCL50177.1 ACP S-malonyltransferase [Leptospira sp. GIMC2001]
MLNNQLAIVFPGQGSQRIGMGLDFYTEYPEARSIYDQANEALGYDIQDICFHENDKINLTKFTQPAILTTEIAMLKVIETEYGIKANYFAGHSLGEYSALVAAGVIDLGSALRIVSKRGELMQYAVPEGIGSMAALVKDDIGQTEFLSIVKQAEVEVANYNSKDQVVISGKTEFIETACKLLSELYPDMNIVRLTVSAPFHSSLIRSIEEDFRKYIIQFPFNFENASKVLSNYTGEFHTQDSLIDNLVSQISGSVDWITNMHRLLELGVEILEVGPNRVLGKFFLSLGKEVNSIINQRSMLKNFKVEQI